MPRMEVPDGTKKHRGSVAEPVSGGWKWEIECRKWNAECQKWKGESHTSVVGKCWADGRLFDPTRLGLREVEFSGFA